MANFVSGQKYLIFRDSETKYYVKLMLSSTPTGLEIGHKQSFSSTFIIIVAPYLRKPPLLVINASGCCEFWEHGKAFPEPTLHLVKYIKRLPASHCIMTSGYLRRLHHSLGNLFMILHVQHDSSISTIL